MRSTPKILLFVTGILLLATGCWHNSDAPAPPKATPVAVAAVYVGSAACEPCHSSEYNSQSHSRHAHTLSVMSRRQLGNLAPPTGRVADTSFVIVRAQDRFGVGNPAESDQVAPLEYALGSGKTGMTYVFVDDRDRTKLVEFRSSYFPHRKEWYVTPGQERLASDELGSVHPAVDARKCILCHAVTLSEDTVVPEAKFFGVGCESCHGPGSAHIAAMSAGSADKTAANTQGKGANGMESLADWPATRLNEMCGRCHGTEQHVKELHLPRDMTNRLQAYGLMQSECFKQSGDTLSCISCHDPHTDVATNPKTYEAVCLRCHTATPTAQRPPQLRTATIKVCPVNPQDKCIGCHMPERRAIPQLPTLMADHDIRVFAGLNSTIPTGKAPTGKTQ